MKKFIQLLKGNIYLVFIYRIFLLYILYTLTRLVFFIYNYGHFTDLNFAGILKALKGGLLFDTSALAYINILYTVLYFVPFRFRHHRYYQNALMVIFLVTNLAAHAINCADIPYYPFVLQRTTIDIIGEFSNEKNLVALFFKFIVDFWPVTLYWLVSSFLLVYFYRKVKVEKARMKSGLLYFVTGLAAFAIIAGLSVAAARGGFRHSTRPITMSNAGAYVKKPDQMAIVLNTPFTLMHSYEIRGYKRETYFTSEAELDKIYTPVHPPSANPQKKENVVIFIIESLNKEFVGSLVPDLNGGKYQGYTPFLDSLIRHSLTFRHSYANGRKSIDALSSVLTSIPRVEMPFVLTPYYRNKLNSLPSLLKEMGYKSAFFHGAPNGSMGFLAFTNLAGVDEYYGKTEYNNDKDFDGIWGIWDEPFMQYFANTLDTFSQPFVATLFSVSSHHPFILPEKYKNSFRKGDFPLETCVEYTDYSLRRFFENASRQPWFNNTLFIITADHVSLNQREEFKNDIGYFSIPIIFYKPGSDMVGLDTVTNAEQIDIMPTVLDYLGYNKPYVAFGKDLLKRQGPNYAFNYLNDSYRLFMDDYLLLFDGQKPKGFYHLDSYRTLGPDQKKLNSPREQEMETFLKAYIQQYVNRMIDNNLTVKPAQ